jgi:protein ImuB
LQKKTLASEGAALAAIKRWGIQTLGELAALPAAALAARMGGRAAFWQAIARGDDVRPLVPDRPEERFEATLELEWPIEGLEPLSFVLTRLLEPLSIQLERRDRGAAVLHLLLRLITRESYLRRLQLSTPMRDVRALRTLALLDLESHPPPAAVDAVTLVIDPTPGRVLQHTLFTRPQPTPEQLSTLLARLAAVMGPDRVGAPATVDSYRPGGFELRPFTPDTPADGDPGSAMGEGRVALTSGFRRCRHPVAARVLVEGGRPTRVATTRQGFSGGSVRSCAGPWRVSGCWWNAGTPGLPPAWTHEQWEVALTDGGVYRIVRDVETDRWFIEAIAD